MLTPSELVYGGTTHAAFRDLLTDGWSVDAPTRLGARGALDAILAGGCAGIICARGSAIFAGFWPTCGFDLVNLLWDLRAPEPLDYDVRSCGSLPGIRVSGKVLISDDDADTWKAAHTKPERFALNEARRKLLELPVIIIRLQERP